MWQHHGDVWVIRKAFERERLAVIAVKWQRLVIGGIISVVIAWGIPIYIMISDLFLAMPIPFFVVLLGLHIIATAVLLGAWAWARVPVNAYEVRLRNKLMSVACNYLGISSYRHDEITNFDLQPFFDVDVAPRGNVSMLENLIEGTYRDCRFTLVEVSMLNNRPASRSRHTIFHGLLARISIPERVDGTILFARRYGSRINSAPGRFRNGTRVEIPHVAFEKKYEVYASSERLALDVVSQAFIENFMKLPQVVESDRLRAAFFGENFLMSVNGVYEFLDYFSVRTPTAELDLVFRSIVQDMGLIHRIIDQLHEPGQAAQDASLGDR